MATPISGLTPYCGVSDFLNRFDTGDVIQWVSEIQQSPVSASELTTNTKLLAALNGASGEVEAACLVGNRYAAGDLAILTGNSLDFLRDICAWLAFDRLTNIHPYAPDAPVHKKVEWAEDMLQKLRDGHRIFSFQEVAKANNIPDAYYLTNQDLVNRNSISVQAKAFYGQRAQWNVPGQN